MPAATPGSDAAVFYTDQRKALLSDPSITEKKMVGTSKTWASGFVSARDRWPHLAQEARAFATG
jgi:hypothetical protein